MQRQVETIRNEDQVLIKDIYSETQLYALSRYGREQFTPWLTRCSHTEEAFIVNNMLVPLSKHIKEGRTDEVPTST